MARSVWQCRYAYDTACVAGQQWLSRVQDNGVAAYEAALSYPTCIFADHSGPGTPSQHNCRDVTGLSAASGLGGALPSLLGQMQAHMGLA